MVGDSIGDVKGLKKGFLGLPIVNLVTKASVAVTVLVGAAMEVARGEAEVVLG